MPIRRLGSARKALDEEPSHVEALLLLAKVEHYLGHARSGTVASRAGPGGGHRSPAMVADAVVLARICRTIVCKDQVMALAVKAVFLAPGHRRRAGLATPNRPNAQTTVSN